MRRLLALLACAVVGLLYGTGWWGVRPMQWKSAHTARDALRGALPRGRPSPLLPPPPPPATPQAHPPGPLSLAATLAFNLPHCNRSAHAGGPPRAVIVSAYFDVPTQKRTR